MNRQENSMDLAGKTIVITGGARGLGAAMAKRLAAAGCQLALVDLDEAALKATAEECLKAGSPKAQGYIANVAKEAEVEALFDSIAADFGPIHGLVNNAGIIRREPALEFSEQYWDDVLQINLKALFFLSQAAARVMVQQGGGKIISIASMLSFQGGILVPSYTAAKSGVAGLTRALANEWAAKGINVNAIAPGYMATDNTAPLRADPQRSQAILSRIPVGRWGQPAELKGVAVFLASAASDYMHGAIVPVDGGWLAR